MDPAELDEIFGPRPPDPRFPEPYLLDEVFASRSHVRLLRVLFGTPSRVNMSIRDLGRYAGVSNSRTLQVLEELCRIGLARLEPTPWHFLVRAATRHPLTAPIDELLLRERQIATAIDAVNRSVPLQDPLDPGGLEGYVEICCEPGPRRADAGRKAGLPFDERVSPR